jgi:hypothetical protein
MMILLLFQLQKLGKCLRKEARGTNGSDRGKKRERVHLTHKCQRASKSYRGKSLSSMGGGRLCLELSFSTVWVMGQSVFACKKQPFASFFVFCDGDSTIRV